MQNSFPVNFQTLMISDGPDKTVYYPQVIGTHDQAWERTVNHHIAALTQKLIDMHVEDMPETLVQMMGTYDIKNNQRDVLSLTITNGAYHYHAAHGMTYIKSLSFDMQHRKAYKLNELFKPGSHYSTRLTELINAQIKERGIETLNALPTIGADQDFYIADKTVVIYFQLYEITPYVFGFPMFPISVYDLLDMIDEEGPLGKLAENN